MVAHLCVCTYIHPIGCAHSDARHWLYVNGRALLVARNMVHAFGYITLAARIWRISYPSSFPLPWHKGRRKGRGGRRHCLILCELFQSLQVSKSSTGFMRFFIHNYYEFLSFSTGLMIFQVPTSLMR